MNRTRRALRNARRCFAFTLAMTIITILDPYIPTLFDLIPDTTPTYYLDNTDDE